MNISDCREETLSFDDVENGFKCDFFFFTYGDLSESIHRRHLNLLLHGDFTSYKVLYPQPDPIDLRELLEGKTIPADAAVFSTSNIGDAIGQWLSEIKKRHSIEGKNVLMVVDGDVGMPEVCDIMEKLEEYGIDPSPVAYWDDSVHANVSLWWVDCASSKEGEQKGGKS